MVIKMRYEFFTSNFNSINKQKTHSHRNGTTHSIEWWPALTNLNPRFLNEEVICSNQRLQYSRGLIGFVKYFAWYIDKKKIPRKLTTNKIIMNIKTSKSKRTHEKCGGTTIGASFFIRIELNLPNRLFCE